MAIGARNVGLFHIADDFVLFALANLAVFTIHKRCANLVAATLANQGPERNLMILLVVVETLHDDVLKLSVLVLAEFPVADVLFEFSRADQAVFDLFVGLLDDVGALVAYFPALGDAVGEVRVVEAGEFDFVGKALVEVVAAQGGILHIMVLHI